eukprot:scaffold10186_cov154-Isochrysis_galbana.AAC.3
MAPRQLILPPMEGDLHPEPGSKRVRPSSDEKSSMQVQLRACASACGTPWPDPAHWLALLALPWANGQSWPLLATEECAAKTLLSVAAPPFTTTASAVYYNPLRRTPHCCSLLPLPRGTTMHPPPYFHPAVANLNPTLFSG